MSEEKPTADELESVARCRYRGASDSGDCWEGYTLQCAGDVLFAASGIVSAIDRLTAEQSRTADAIERWWVTHHRKPPHDLNWRCSDPACVCQVRSA